MAESDPRTVRRVLLDAGIEVGEIGVQIADPGGDVLRFDVPRGAALSTWEAIRPLVPQLGHYPLVCRDEHGTLAELPEMEEGGVGEILRAAQGIEPAPWLAEREADDPELYGDVESGTEEDWHGVEPQSAFTVPVDNRGRPAAGVWIALVPTTSPWEALAHLRFGGWNECPDAEVHVAMQRDWHRRFGAEVVCVSGDTIEFRVAEPPLERDAALQLAREQFVYSGGDLVYQGTETLNALAASLLGAGTWFVWWD